MADADTEKKHSVPPTILEHLTAAHDYADDPEALYHIREAIQISRSEIETEIGIDVAEE